MSLKKKTQVIFVSGVPGVGKSFLADLLIKEILMNPRHSFEKAKEIRYVYNYKPLIPNTFFSRIYRRCDPSEKRHLIVLIDEVDVMLDQIHHRTVDPCPKFPTEVNDKTSWNRFLDNFDRGYYLWTTIIFTSNREKEYIDGLDPSYLREGRIDFSETIRKE